jgi:hypothetical protein
MGTVILNPNKDKDVKATEKLNYLSKSFRNSAFFRRNTIEEGFELNVHDFKWEWMIKNGKKLIVLRERDDKEDIEIWGYSDGEKDISPKLHMKIMLTKAKHINCSKMNRLIEYMFNNM